ncbi:MAG: hypothetical protein M8364_21300, partial [Methylobacter sp.]|uniref:hypothetical protein n=1 Tax=Methylobacter sp. TaxID=2051955 RepID=UPI00258263A4
LAGLTLPSGGCPPDCAGHPPLISSVERAISDLKQPIENTQRPAENGTYAKLCISAIMYSSGLCAVDRAKPRVTEPAGQITSHNFRFQEQHHIF